MKPHKRARSAGFTLAELLVVMAIIGIVAVVTVIAVGRIARDARLASATNTVTASLGNARAIAMKTNEPVMVVFDVFWTPGIEQQTQITLTRWTGDSVLIPRFFGLEVKDRFVPIQDQPVRMLPPGIKVAAPWYDVNEDETWITQPELSKTDPTGGAPEAPGRMLGFIFAPDGSIVTTNPTSTSDVSFVDFDLDGGQTIGATSGGSRFWVYDEPDDEPNVEPVPFLAVYDDAEAREFRVTAWQTDGDYAAELTGPQGYIALRANPLHFNRFTGVTMR
jgi:prepilin-type N-terminal cleavage/methylation domain-containing protein